MARSGYRSLPFRSTAVVGEMPLSGRAVPGYLEKPTVLTGLWEPGGGEMFTSIIRERIPFAIAATNTGWRSP
jgi:hypothetical protein